MSIIQQPPANGTPPQSEQDRLATPAQGGNPSQQVPNQGEGKSDNQYDWKAPVNPAPGTVPTIPEILKNNGIRTIPGVTPGTCSTDHVQGQPNLPHLQNGRRICSI